MKDTIDTLMIKLCENLPLDGTFFEKDSMCEKKTTDCEYSRRLNEKEFLCYKKTYTSTLNIV